MDSCFFGNCLIAQTISLSNRYLTKPSNLWLGSLEQEIKFPLSISIYFASKKSKKPFYMTIIKIIAAFYIHNRITSFSSNFDAFRCHRGNLKIVLNTFFTYKYFGKDKNTKKQTYRQTEIEGISKMETIKSVLDRIQLFISTNMEEIQPLSASFEGTSSLWKVLFLFVTVALMTLAASISLKSK